MVQTDNGQLATEAAEWRQILRTYKTEFNDCQKALEDLCKLKLSKDELLAVEHFQNLFHIHLINIHDVKQRIKRHENRMQLELAGGNGNYLQQEHENLLEDFIVLENALQQLREDFSSFIENATD